MKQFIAYICLFVFSFQVLPVKELGKLLGKAQNTEEVHDCGSDNNTAKEKKDDFKFHSVLSETDALISFEHKVAVSLHATDNIPEHYVPDIPTPPPNRC